MSNTQKVLEKWGVEGGDMNEEDVKKAAESFARIQVKNRFLKRVAFGGVLFLVVFMGLMLGSVILGIDISKDFKVKNHVLVQKGNNSNVLQTGEIFYSVKLGLTAPLSTIKGIKSLKFQTKDGILQFNVVSFYYIYGRNLTLYGNNHVANVLGNGDVEVYPIKMVNGAKRIDESQVKRTGNGDSYASGTNDNGNNGVVLIHDCQGLRNVQTNGKYSLLNNIECTLTSPLLPNGFNGIFNGNGHIITLHMNTNGPAALFSSVLSNGKIANTLLRGDITGVHDCAGFTVSAYAGANFLANGMYATIRCSNNPSSSEYQALGGIAALLRNPTGSNQQVSFMFSVSQGILTASVSNPSLITYVGSFYGRTGIQEAVRTKFTFTYAASRLDRYADTCRVDHFGFKYSFPTAKNSMKRDVYVPEDCYGGSPSNPDYINMCVDWFVTYYYENQDCCSDFDSCPYVQCDRYSQVCMNCRHKKKDVTAENVEIIPTVHSLCEGF